MAGAPDATRAMQARGFYRGDCAAQVRALLQGYRPRTTGTVYGAVVPHAGWCYSGRIAAQVYAELALRPPETIVFLATTHRWGRRQVALHPAPSWETPLGPVPLDALLAGEVQRALGADLVVSAEAHEGDHAIEVQLPLLRVLLPDAAIVPLAFPPRPDAHELGARLGAALARQRRGLAVVSSTDLTHYGEDYGHTPAGTGPEARAHMEARDRRLIELVCKLEDGSIVPEALAESSACGPGGLAAATAAARALGARRGQLLEYTHSHDVAPEPGPFRSVGYAGIVFTG